MHRLVIEGVDTIVYGAIIVRTYTAFKSSAWPFLSRSKKIARAHKKFYTNTSYFSMLNQIATFKVAISFIGVASRALSERQAYNRHRGLGAAPEKSELTAVQTGSMIW